MNTAEHKYWTNWETIGGMSDGGSSADVDVMIDESGGYHLFSRYGNGRYIDRAVTARQAAEFCLKAMIPEQLQNLFKIQ